MQEQYHINKVTALLAESDRHQNALVQSYAKGQDMVELCAAVRDGDRVLELLRAGLRPRVLVLDTMLASCGLLELLSRLPEIEPGYDPSVLVTTVPISEATARPLLTLGAHYIILKPYTLPSLFDAIFQYGCQPKELELYRIRGYLRAALRELQAGVHSCGAFYLEQILYRLVLTDRQYTLGELYTFVGNGEHVTNGAVNSAIRRLAQRAYAEHTPAYVRLCESYGLPQDTALNNTELIYSIAERVRQAMRR